MTADRNAELRALAQRVADALPTGLVDEVVLTGSVSRGMADDVSDIEMLVVTREPLQLGDCFRLARSAGLDEIDTWGEQGGSTKRVSGHRDGVPLELIWWSSEDAEAQVDELLRGAMHATADALVHGVALRTGGRLSVWQERLRSYPPELAAAQIEDAAQRWGGFTPAGFLTLLRPGDRLTLVEWMVDASLRVLTIVFATNRVWRPTTKRLAQRVATLPVKPDRLAERIDEALTEVDARRALRLLTEVQLDTVLLAPSGPNVDRARRWLAAGADLLGPPAPTLPRSPGAAP